MSLLVRTLPTMQILMITFQRVNLFVLALDVGFDTFSNTVGSRQAQSWVHEDEIKSFEDPK